jgi:hypothetical protein
MGGIVQDQQSSPQKYGVTCAHVMTSGTVDQPAKVDSKRAAVIGIVSSHTPLQLPVGLCTLASISGVNTVDIALIEIDPSTSADLEVLDIGPLTGITPIAKIGQGQLVEFTGRSSGNRTLRTGGLGVIYKLKWNGQDYCFQNVIQIGRSVTGSDRRRAAHLYQRLGRWVDNPQGTAGLTCADGFVTGRDLCFPFVAGLGTVVHRLLQCHVAARF